MKKIIVIVIVMAIAGGVIFLLVKYGAKNNSASPISDTGTGALPSVTTTTVAASLPAGGASQGDTIALQAVGGAVTVKNFYNNGKGYVPSMDVVVLEQNASYVIWYHRSTSHFEIWPPAGAGMADEAAATAALRNDLGIDTASLCRLSVNMVLVYDGGNTTESAPLSACSRGVFQ